MNTTHALVQLAQTLDLLAALAWCLAAITVLVTLRMTWLRLTTPMPEISRWLLPVALPVDLPTGPVPPYGPAQGRAAYPGSMARAIGAASGLVPLVLLLALAVASRRPVSLPNPPRPRPGPVIEMVSPATPLTAPPPTPSGPSLPESFKDFLKAIIHPVRNAGADSLEILERESWARGLNDGPGDGRGYDGPPGPEGPDTGPWGIPNPDLEPGPGAAPIADVLPVLVTLPAPRYPEMARQAGVEGRVLLRLLVGVTGKVEKVQVVESIPTLDEAARAAALEARFRPATWQDRPVRVWITLPIRFRLSDIP